MKKLVISLSLLLVLSFVIKANVFPINLAKYHLEEEERPVSNFRGVAAGGAINVVVKIGAKESVRLVGDADAIADLVTEVKANILIIKPKTKWNDWYLKYKNAKVTVFVTAKTITSLTMSGSGNITVEDKITGDNLALNVSGSGTIKTSVDVNRFSGVISGSGGINVAGTADEANVVVSGSGSFSGKTLNVNNVNTQISGSGGVNIIANQTLNAAISGSGSVSYTGNATVEKRIVGSGRVRKM